MVLGAGLVHEVHKVAHAPLPHFEDNDPSGVYGDPLGATVQVTVLGDSSVTAPGLASGRLSWIALACDSMDSRIELRSLAKGGSRVADVLTAQLPALLEDPPEVAVLAIGSNDVMHATPTRVFRRRLGEVLDALSSVCAVVTVGVGDLSVIPRLTPALRGLAARRSATIDRIHAQECDRRTDVVRVDVRRSADPFFASAGPGLFTADAFHPNEVGHHIWAGCFTEPLRCAIEASSEVVIDLTDGSTPRCARMLPGRTLSDRCCEGSARPARRCAAPTP